MDLKSLEMEKNPVNCIDYPNKTSDLDKLNELISLLDEIKSAYIKIRIAKDKSKSLFISKYIEYWEIRKMKLIGL